MSTPLTSCFSNLLNGFQYTVTILVLGQTGVSSARIGFVICRRGYTKIGHNG